MIGGHSKLFLKLGKRMISDFLKKWFLFCSGAYLDILLQDDCKNEHNKYIGIGTSVFFTGVFAFMSSYYAIFIVFKSTVIAIVIGIVWGCFIFSLDRYIVATLKKENRKGIMAYLIEIVKASPRFVLAIFLSSIISKPLELKLFEREIENELILMHQDVIKDQEQRVRDRYEPSINEKQNEINQLQSQIDEAKQKYDNLRQQANIEADGSGGSKKRGIGRVFRLKQEAADEQEQVWKDLDNTNSPLISELRSQNETDREKLRKDLGNLKRVQFDGLLASIGALDNLTKKNESMYWGNWAIMILFLVIELAPLIFKIMTDRGNYDVKIQMLEERVYAEEIERISNINDEINKRVKIKVGENKNLIERELVDNKELMNEISNAQLSLAKEIITIWEQDQMKKIRENPVKYVGGLVREEQEKEVKSTENGIKDEEETSMEQNTQW